jgi:hypothetical protein
MATATPALDRLRPQERAGLLSELLATHPELAEELEARALARIHDVDADVIARHLKERLDELPLTDLAARAGRQPGHYVHETDAANEIVAEALAPYEDDLWRAVALDLDDASRATLLGIVVGLHRCRDAPNATVLAYAGPDTPAEHAAWLVRQAHDVGIELHPDEVEARCPGWILLPSGLRQT